MASDIPDGDICTRVGNVCVNCDELWPCRVRLQATTARLQALLAERDAEIARLVELGERMRLSAMYYAANGGDVLCIEFHAACEAWRAALAARGGEVQG